MADKLNKEEKTDTISRKDLITMLGQAEVHSSMAEMEMSAVEQLYRRCGFSTAHIETLRKNIIQLMLQANQLQKEV